MDANIKRLVVRDERENCIKDNADEYEDYTDNRPDIGRVTVAHAPAQTGVGDPRNSGAKENGIEEFHALIVA